jgi:hypothetical protein
MTEFNGMVMRALAALYGSHPVPQTIEPATLRDSSNVEDRNQAENATILWLIRTGLVEGDHQGSNESHAITNAHLSERALRVLRTPEPNQLPRLPLGQLAADAVGGETEDDVSDLVMMRIQPN